MSIEKKNKSWLVFDSGLYLDLANSLGKHGDEVHYFTPYSASFFPKYSDYAIGKGFEHIKKELYLFDLIDKVDAIACFEVAGNDLINFIKKHFPDKPCFGSSSGQKLEDSRWKLKKVLQAAGIRSARAVKLKGVHALCDYIIKNPKKFIKVSIFRGSINSFYAKDYKSVEQFMEYCEHELGAFSEDFEFIVEDEIPTSQEWGYDGFFDGNDYVKPYFFGVEISKDSYIAKVSDTLPNQLENVNKKFFPIMKQLGWQGCISNELKLVSKEDSYFLDLCSRAPNPCGLIYSEFIDNWPEMCYDIACGKPTKMECKVKYVGAVPLYSKHTKKSDTQVNFPKELRKNVKFMTAYCKDGRFYAIKDSPEELVCVVVAGDNTVDGLIKQLKKYVDEVDCHGIDKNAVGGLDKINEIISESSKVGISF